MVLENWTSESRGREVVEKNLFSGGRVSVYVDGRFCRQEAGRKQAGSRREAGETQAGGGGVQMQSDFSTKNMNPRRETLMRIRAM